MTKGRFLRLPRMRSLVSIFCIALCAMVQVPAAHGQNEPVFDGIAVLSARPIFENINAEWLPFLVALENRSGSNRTIEVVLESSTGDQNNPVRWRVELSPGAVKRQVIPAYAGRQGWATRIRTKLYEGGSRITPEWSSGLDYNLSRGNFNNRRSQPLNLLFVIPDRTTEVGDFEDPFNRAYRRASSASGGLVYATILGSEMPVAPDAYGAIDRLVFVGVGPDDLNAAQRRSVLRAVSGGVTAWVFPGKAGEGNSWVFQDDTKLPGGTLLTVDEEPVTVFLATGENEDGEPISEIYADDGTAVTSIYRYPTGQGEWRRLTATSLFERSELEVDLARRGTAVDLHPIPMTTDQWSGSRFDSGGGRWHQYLDKLFRKDVPLAWVFFLLTAYLLVIGPGLFWYLKRKGRLILLLWLQPVVVVAFLATTAILGRIHFGSLDRADETVLVFLPSGSQWGTASVVHTQFTAGEDVRDLTSKDGTLPVLLASGSARRSLHWSLDGGGGNRLENFRFPPWSFSHFITSGPVNMRGTLRARRDALDRVQVINELPFAVSNPLLKGGMRFLQTIEAGTMERLTLDSANARPMIRSTEDAEWLNVMNSARRRIANSGVNGRILLLEFDPSDLNIPFVIEGEKRGRRGILAVVIEESQ